MTQPIQPSYNTPPFNAVTYMKQIEEIFVWLSSLVENFASANPPVNPRPGQFWFDTSSLDPSLHQLKQYRNGGWANFLSSSDPIFSNVTTAIATLTDLINGHLNATTNAHDATEIYTNQAVTGITGSDNVLTSLKALYDALVAHQNLTTTAHGISAIDWTTMPYSDGSLDLGYGPITSIGKALTDIIAKMKSEYFTRLTITTSVYEVGNSGTFPTESPTLFMKSDGTGSFGSSLRIGHFLQLDVNNDNTITFTQKGTFFTPPAPTEDELYTRDSAPKTVDVATQVSPALFIANRFAMLPVAGGGVSIKRTSPLSTFPQDAYVPKFRPEVASPCNFQKEEVVGAVTTAHNVSFVVTGDDISCRVESVVV